MSILLVLPQYQLAIRVCCKCSTEKELTQDNFYRRAARPGGFQYACKVCINGEAAWKKQDPEKRHAAVRRWYRTENGQKWAFRAKLRRYGLTQEQYEGLIASQNGNCAVCGLSLDVPVIDHCHATGRTRGILHGNCNVLLGLAGENTDVLKGAIAYLERNIEQHRT